MHGKKRLNCMCARPHAVSTGVQALANKKTQGHRQALDRIES